MKKTIVALGCVVLTALFVVPANATLIGDEVNARWIFNPFPFLFDENENFTVGAGPETTNWVDSGSTLDFGESSIVFTPNLNIGGLASGLTWIFSSLDWNPQAAIVGVTAITVWSNWSDSFISFTDNSITVAFTNVVLFGTGDRSLTLNITTRQGEIPEPTSLALLGAGAAGLIARRRRIV